MGLAELSGHNKYKSNGKKTRKKSKKKGTAAATVVEALAMSIRADKGRDGHSHGQTTTMLGAMAGTTSAKSDGAAIDIIDIDSNRDRNSDREEGGGGEGGRWKSCRKSFRGFFRTGTNKAFTATNVPPQAVAARNQRQSQRRSHQEQDGPCGRSDTNDNDGEPTQTHTGDAAAARRSLRAGTSDT